MRIRNPRRLRLRGTVAAVAVVAAGAGAITMSAARGEPSGQAVSHEDNRGVAPAVQPDQAKGFAVFAGQRGANDSMTAEALEQVGSSRHSGRNADLSRAIRTPTGRGWAVPGNGTICLVVPDPVDGFGVTCGETAVARRNGLSLMMISPDSPSVTQLSMIMPRGGRVEARANDGRLRRLEQDAQGVVSANLQDVKELVLTTSEGTQSVPMPVAPPKPPRP